MKIEKNMYVRTIFGIAKIINMNDFREPAFKYGLEANYLKDIVFIGDKDILKASYNIIDLIEEGDYVNGYQVVFIREDENGEKWVYSRYDDMYRLCEKEIGSIVTKEQFKNIEYEVK